MNFKELLQKIPYLLEINSEMPMNKDTSAVYFKIIWREGIDKEVGPRWITVEVGGWACGDLLHHSVYLCLFEISYNRKFKRDRR